MDLDASPTPSPLRDPRDPYLTLEQATRWVRFPHEIARRLLAANPSLAPVAQELLVDDADPETRTTLAGNPGLEPRAQADLARDASSEARVALARNRSTTPGVRALLSFDPDGPVRHVLVRNPFIRFSVEMAVPFLLEHAEGRDDVRHCLEHLDPTTTRALTESWTGSLASLRHACELLGPDGLRAAQAHPSPARVRAHPASSTITR